MTQIREATVQDIPRIVSVYNAAIRSSDTRSQEEIDFLLCTNEIIDDNLFSDEKYTIVATIDSRVIGWVSLDEGDSRIDGLFVEPEYHGNGIGTELMDEIEEYATEKEHNALSIPAAKDAVEFYEKIGYECLGSYDIVDGVEITIYPMFKLLETDLINEV